jgi:hypothetical protein
MFEDEPRTYHQSAKKEKEKYFFHKSYGFHSLQRVLNAIENLCGSI